MTYLEEFAEQLRAKLAGKLPEQDVNDIVEFAVTTCRESWKNGMDAGKKRAGNGKAPADKRTPQKHYKGDK